MLGVSPQPKEDPMYAIGSREELEALVRQLAANTKVTRALLSDGQHEQAADMLEISDLYAAMLQQALADHFNGKN